MTDAVSNSKPKEDSQATDASAGLGYKSQNIINTKSHKSPDASFARPKKRCKELQEHWRDMEPKRKRTILVNAALVLLILLLGSWIALTIVYMNSSKQTTTDTTASEGGEGTSEDASIFDSMVEAQDAERSNQTAAAKAEADATNDTNQKAEAFSKRINSSLEQGDISVVGTLIDEGDAYFMGLNDPTGALAMYTGIDYDRLSIIGSLLPYYQRIMDLANEVGDNATKEAWQARYDEAKAEMENYVDYDLEDKE